MQFNEPLTRLAPNSLTDTLNLNPTSLSFPLSLSRSLICNEFMALLIGRRLRKSLKACERAPLCGCTKWLKEKLNAHKYECLRCLSCSGRTIVCSLVCAISRSRSVALSEYHEYKNTWNSFRFSVESQTQRSRTCVDVARKNYLWVFQIIN